VRSPSIRTALLLPSLVVAASLAGQARAQSVLPETGTAVNLGSLRQQLEGVLATGTGGTPTTPGWTFTPSVTLEQRWTDLGQNNQRESVFLTDVRPDLLVTGDMSRLQTTLSYSPEVLLGTDGERRFGQNLNAQALATLVPEHAFLDLRGFAGLQSTSGGYGPNSTVSLSNQNETQTTNFSATPYLRQRFDDVGSMEEGVSLGYNSAQTMGKNTSAAWQQAADSSNQTSTTTREHVSFTSGPDFGRFATNPLASGMQGYGTGVMNGAYRYSFSVDNGYALSRNFTLLGKLGYESLHYSGVPPYSYDGGLWDVGVRWVPNPDSSIEVRYGAHEGRTSAYVNASYAPGARTRLFARYSEALTTEDEDLQNAINSSVLDPLGNPVDQQTGAPLVLASNSFGVYNNLAWVKQGSLTGMLLLDRDTFSASVSYQNRRQVAAANAATARYNLATSGTFGSLNWQHDFGEDLTSLAFVQYGKNNSTASLLLPSSSTDLVLSFGLNYILSETINISLQYSYTNQTASYYPSPPINLVVLSIRKVF
jgi:uncharacterized protein (PEP-CTERM system associated)